MRYLLVILLASFTSASPASAAESLALPAAVQEAEQANPGLQRAMSAGEEARWKENEALSNFLPTVSVGASHLFSKKYAFTDVTLGGSLVSVPNVVPSTVYTLSARLPLFDGLASVYRYRAAGFQNRAAARELDWARFQLERDVILQFYRAVGAARLEQVASQNVRTLEDHLKDVRLFQRAGVSTNYDLLRVEVQVSEARSAQLDAADNLAVAKSRLAESMGRNTDPRRPAGDLPILLPNIVEGLKEANPGDRTDLQALGERSESVARLGSAASLWLVPKLYLFGDYQYYNNRDADSLWGKPAFREAYQFGLGVSWNLFDGGTSLARSHESAEQSFQAEKALEQGRLRAGRDFEFWRRKFLYYCSVFASRQGDVEKSREAVRLAREGRRVGTRTNTDLLDAEADYFRSEAGLVNAQLGAIEALLNLEIATGRTLHRFY